MTSRDYSREVLDAFEAKDLKSLAALAMELAKRAAVAEELERRETERKALRTEQKRAERARRRATSRDSVRQDATSQDGETLSTKNLRSTTKATTKPKVSSRTAEVPLAGVSWVDRLTGVWTSLAGAVQRGQVGKALKPIVDAKGEAAVERGMRVYIARRQRDAAPLNFGWFAADAVQWVDRAATMAVDNGTMNDALDLLTQVPGKRT